MKKKLMAVLLTAILAGCLAGCSKDTSDLVYLKDFKAGKFVTLGEYKGVEVNVAEHQVTQEDFEMYLDYMLQMDAVYVPVTDRAVETGDVANIDFEGKRDGIAFEGGTSQGYDLTIGSGRFIPGFEDSVIGMEIGETKDIPLTFPEVYDSNPDLAGAEVIFTVTVNSISAPEVPELTDEYVAGLGFEDISTAQEYKDSLYDFLVEQALLDYESEKIDAAVLLIEENSEFKELPQGMVNRMKETLSSNAAQYARLYGMDVGSYVSAVYGGTAEEYEKTLLDQAELTAQHYILMAAIADAEGITVDDAELEEYIAQQAEASGYTSVEEYKTFIDTEALREFLMAQEAAEFLGENAVAVGTAE